MRQQSTLQQGSTEAPDGCRSNTHPPAGWSLGRHLSGPRKPLAAASWAGCCIQRRYGSGPVGETQTGRGAGRGWWAGASQQLGGNPAAAAAAAAAPPAAAPAPTAVSSTGLCPTSARQEAHQLCKGGQLRQSCWQCALQPGTAHVQLRHSTRCVARDALPCYRWTAGGGPVGPFCARQPLLRILPVGDCASKGH